MWTHEIWEVRYTLSDGIVMRGPTFRQFGEAKHHALKQDARYKCNLSELWKITESGDRCVRYSQTHAKWWRNL